ncbi:unnamed protein product [Ranitomeya imitator]|uniref:Sorting nexin C-terminal domain-containing protein n=1 Tax=Ranitomeya imitator TaxID=111125 RepID=A0ABN9M538_9NEOB|nr:unnamed protein product [Ranitomeya imitator]
MPPVTPLYHRRPSGKKIYLIYFIDPIFGIVINSVFFMLYYELRAGRVVFHISDWLHHLLMGGRILLKNTLETYTDHYLQCKLEQLSQEHRLVSLITLLRDAVFCETTEPRAVSAKQKRAKQTFEEMMAYIPDLIGKCIGEEAKYEGIRLLFDGLQQPVLNKQLSYVLLDIVILDIFPELGKVFPEGYRVSSHTCSPTKRTMSTACTATPYPHRSLSRTKILAHKRAQKSGPGSVPHPLADQSLSEETRTSTSSKDV